MGETAMTGDDTPDRWGEKLGAPGILIRFVICSRRF
jgi:hypothetical protein